MRKIRGPALWAKGGAVTLLAALCLAALPAGVFASPLQVILLVPEGPHAVGSTIPVRVHVFYGGSHADADRLRVLLSGYPLERELPWTRVDVGQYSADFQLQSSDAPRPGGLSVRVEASVGGLSGYGNASLLVAGDLSLAIRLSTLKVLPGGTLGITIVITRSGAPVDAENLEIQAFLYTFPLGPYSPPAAETLTWSRTGVGTYSAEYMIRPDIRQDTSVSISARAKVGSEDVSGQAVAHVESPHPMEVWYHRVSASTNASEIEVWVAGTDGRPVAGADVYLTYQYWAGSPRFPAASSYVLKAARSTTGAGGAARFALNHTGALGVGVGVEGVASAAGQSERFAGFIVIPPPPSPPTFRGLWVVRQEPWRGLLPAGPRVTLNYTAYVGDAPLGAAQLLYYAHSDAKLLGYGQVTTDASGRFSLSFPLEARPTRVEFKAPSEGGGLEATDYIFPYEPLTASHTEVYPGSRTVVSALPPSEGPYLGSVFFSPLDPAGAPLNDPSPRLRDAGEKAKIELSSTVNSTAVNITTNTTVITYVGNPYPPPRWARWSGLPGGALAMELQGGRLSASFVVPTFLSRDVDYLLSVVLVPANFTSSYGLSPRHARFWVLQLGEGPSGASVLAVLLTPMWLGLVGGVMAAALVAVAILAWSRRHRRGPPGELAPPHGAPGSEGAGGPSTGPSSSPSEEPPPKR